MNFLKTIIISFIILISIEKQAKACVPNPLAMPTIIASTCWTCSFPLSIGLVPVLFGPLYDPAPSPGLPICACPFPPPIFVRVGVPVSFFEPSRLIDIVSEPYCFTGFGVSSGVTGSGTLGGQKSTQGTTSKHTFMQAHYLIFPIFATMEWLTDLACVQAPGIDVGYVTEVDPTWNSDALGAYLSPEALLFGNPITNLACIADSVASSVGSPLDALFWCMGGWGNTYPLTGHKNSSDDFIQDTAAIASRMIYKLHRQLLLWGNSGIAGLCSPYPLPIWRKSAYRLQPVLPVPLPMAVPIGVAGTMWTWGKNIPGTFDNFSYLLFKKMDCCAF